MPSYELSLLLRVLSKPELVSTLKKTGETIVEHGGILRQFISMGTKPLPFRMKAHNVWHREGTYFVMKFDAPTASMDIVMDELRRDIDLIKSNLFKQTEKVKFECTLDEELQPPAYREDVKKLIEQGKRVIKPGYQQKSPGFDYYPFQK